MILLLLLIGLIALLLYRQRPLTDQVLAFALRTDQLPRPIVQRLVLIALMIGSLVLMVRQSQLGVISLLITLAQGVLAVLALLHVPVPPLVVQGVGLLLLALLLGLAPIAYVSILRRLHTVESSVRHP
ncbi:hypothetical protein DAETH_42170 (plasmid) [Deinococcus aetherius]|uniref:Uncharacterized protein n=1 Tax=Deinococcus aetherius TaxID=200252 RepID=A0ABM8AK89_9DEIO|nr:hypothetical protein [Deinococcus aetherius]BDP44248.1 hypothetical protein DAETH_42170 [Deinococcus aetherius]